MTYWRATQISWYQFFILKEEMEVVLLRKKLELAKFHLKTYYQLLSVRLPKLWLVYLMPTYLYPIELVRSKVF